MKMRSMLMAAVDGRKKSAAVNQGKRDDDDASTREHVGPEPATSDFFLAAKNSDMLTLTISWISQPAIGFRE